MQLNIPTYQPINNPSVATLVIPTSNKLKIKMTRHFQAGVFPTFNSIASHTNSKKDTKVAERYTSAINPIGWCQVRA